MTDAQTRPSVNVNALYRELEEIVEALNANRGEHEELLSARNDLFQQLLDAGERQREIAKRAGVTSNAVAFGTGKTYKKDAG